jgi:hypothetical protein
MVNPAQQKRRKIVQFEIYILREVFVCLFGCDHFVTLPNCGALQLHFWIYQETHAKEVWMFAIS